MLKHYTIWVLCYDKNEDVRKNETLKEFWNSYEEEISTTHNNQNKEDRFSKMGVFKNKKQTFEWNKKSANQGIAQAQYNLGVDYVYGVGTQVDPVKAAYWIEQAYENGSEKASGFWAENKLWYYKK